MDSSKFLVGTMLKLPSFDEARRHQYKKFWEERGFKFILTDEKMHLARRGAFFKTFFSMSPKYLETKLTASWVNKELECIMEVNLLLQQVTEWHKAFLELEMITFESYMQSDDKKLSLWQEFEEDLKDADTKYTWTCGLFGKKMPADKKRKYLGR
jgi:hypothetical protein